LILSPLTHLLNESIASKTFPTAWKRSKIVPVAKVKNPGWLKDYRPISILPALSKALENIMKDQIVAFCNEKGLLNRFQSGSRPGHSTTTALLKITGDVSMEMDHEFVTILALFDFSKAFNKLCHKLKTIFFFSDSVIELIKSYLTDRH
jgi:Reverse transcriptase (RNA-dependent DNA polymerase)